MNIRGFAVDIDGTITEDGGRISLDATHVLRWLEDSGYRVVLVSGRGIWDTYALALFLGTTKVVVAENGGVVAFSPQDIEVLADKFSSLMAYDCLARHIQGVKLRPGFPRLTSLVLERTFELEEGERVLKENKLPVTILDSGYGYHLTPRGVDKAEGLRIALKHLGLDLKEVVAIGDSDTDVPMFKACGYSVALGNSSESVRSKACFSVKGKMGEGLIEAVQHVFDIFIKARLPKGV